MTIIATVTTAAAPPAPPAIGPTKVLKPAFITKLTKTNKYLHMY